MQSLFSKQQEGSTQANNNGKKKKGGQPKDEKSPSIAQHDILTNYKYLPFQATDVLKLFSVVKQLKVQNQDTRSLLSQANQAYKEQNMEKAFELYSQAINLLLQITGPMNKDLATCISKIASIQFKTGDLLQALELQTKAIVLQERLLGLDHPQCAFSYSTLAMYYHSCSYNSKAFEYMYRALNILTIAAGDYHPDIASVYMNLGLMYEETDNHDAAYTCYEINLQQHIEMYGADHIQTAGAYQSLATSAFRGMKFRVALEHQEKAYELLKKVLPADSPYIQHSKAQLDQYVKISVNYEKQKAQAARPIGQNKQ